MRAKIMDGKPFIIILLPTFGIRAIAVHGRETIA